MAASGGPAVTARNVAVFQPLPGIGDMVWHLPHIRAVAAHVGGPVTLVAKPRSAADQVFAGEATVRDVLWLDRNPERRRGRHDGPVGLARLVAELRLRRFDSAVILHHSRMLAFAAMAPMPNPPPSAPSVTHLDIDKAIDAKLYAISPLIFAIFLNFLFESAISLLTCF